MHPVSDLSIGSIEGKQSSPSSRGDPKKDAGARIGSVNTVRTGYSAYAVGGNVVMMCELELSSLVTTTQEATRSTICPEIDAGYSDSTELFRCFGRLSYLLATPTAYTHKAPLFI
jgi:hypothetical protein